MIDDVDCGKMSKLPPIDHATTVEPERIVEENNEAKVLAIDSRDEYKRLNILNEISSIEEKNLALQRERERAVPRRSKLQPFTVPDRLHNRS